MRVVKLMMLVAILGLVTGCSCKSKQVGDGDNIPLVSDEGPLRDVNFAFDSSALDAKAKAILRENADWLQANAAVKTEVEGHCDNRGTQEYNLALGSRRAQSVVDYIRSLGVDGARLKTISYGEEMPLDPRDNEEAWGKNRRAHFRILQ